MRPRRRRGRRTPSRHHPLVHVASRRSAEDFAERGKEPDDEVHVFSWLDSTLSEVAALVMQHDLAVRLSSAFDKAAGEQAVEPVAATGVARLSFSIVYPGERPPVLDRRPPT